MDTLTSPLGDFLDQAVEHIGSSNVLTEHSDKEGHLAELRKLFVGESAAVLRPNTTEQVSAIMRLANEHGVAIVPQGGNTGLVGGQIPDMTGDQIILSLSRLNRVRDVDPAGNTIVVESGCVLENLHKAADAVDRLFPLTLGSMGSCQIGGNLSTNAGGTAVLAYGNTRDLVLGLEVVLADGRIWNGLRRLRKDNTGYDLKHLFVGAEGTLGIITAAVLKLFPKPASRQVAFLGVSNPQTAGQLFSRVKSEFGNALTGFEIIRRTGIEIAVRNLEGVRDPLESECPWYILLEISGGREAAADSSKLESFLADAFEASIILDGTIAQSEQQADAFWHIRHGMSEAQRHEGGSITHDVSVPIARVPEFLDKGIAAIIEIIPDCRPNPFGHFGDGNIHFNISPGYDSDRDAFFGRRDEISSIIYDLTLEMGGSFSAEHGIGQLKRQMLQDVKDPVELALMKSIKQTLDPRGILNPGKVL